MQRSQPAATSSRPLFEARGLFMLRREPTCVQHAILLAALSTALLTRHVLSHPSNLAICLHSCRTCYPWNLVCTRYLAYALEFHAPLNGIELGLILFATWSCIWCE